jgi:peptide-methionine (R)-S-oxide reductase
VAQTPPTESKVVKTDAEWRAILTPEQYHILREKGTERPYTGAYWKTKTAGTYVCAGCGTPLFKSDAKFDSGCGWPSFFEPLAGAKLTESVDHVIGYPRTEICCATCGGHMGHVFDDGPKPTGLRYCINSGSIKLVPAAAAGTNEQKPAAGAQQPPPK